MPVGERSTDLAPPGSHRCATAPKAPGYGEVGEHRASLADWGRNIPYINIDAADTSTPCAAQLLGSGRGIVGSHQSGRLEQAAKHHAGAVIEVSDLDHAVPEARAAMADLFLQILETGRAERHWIYVFLRQPDFRIHDELGLGPLDEKVARGIGFQQQRHNLATGESKSQNHAVRRLFNWDSLFSLNLWWRPWSPSRGPGPPGGPPDRQAP